MALAIWLLLNFGTGTD